MRDLLPQFGPNLNTNLFPPTILNAILTLAAQLPPLSGVGLEYHLGRTPSRTDFLIRAGSFDGGRQALAGQHAHFRFTPHPQTQPAWQPVFDFGRAWANPAGPLFDQVENVWLEFDILPEADTLPTPAIFFDLDRSGRLSLPETMTVLRSALAILAPHWPPTTLHHIAACLQNAPFPARLYYLGLMLPRPTDAARVCLSGLAHFQIPAALQTLGWPGDGQAVARALDAYAPNIDKLVLDLDIGTAIGETVGVEIFPPDQAAWSTILAVLVAAGYGSSDEAEHLLTWPGHEPFPAGELRQTLSTIHQREIRHLFYRLNHLKLSFDSQGNFAAKVYLYLCYA